MRKTALLIPLVFSLLLTGQQAYNPLSPVLVTGIALNAVATTTILNESTQGRLITVGCININNPTGNPIVNLDVTIDGEATQTFNVYTGGGTTYSFGTQPSVVSIFGTNNPYGNNVGDGFTFRFDSEYNTSLLVEFDVTTGGTGGSMSCAVLRAVRI